MQFFFLIELAEVLLHYDHRCESRFVMMVVVLVAFSTFICQHPFDVCEYSSQMVLRMRHCLYTIFFLLLVAREIAPTVHV
jgi:hypothetical protein